MCTNGVQSRCSPKALAEVNSALSDEQMADVREIGLGGLLSTPSVRLNHGLCLYLVENFDYISHHDCYRLHIDGTDINVAPEDVNAIMGLAAEGTDVPISKGSLEEMKLVAEKLGLETTTTYRLKKDLMEIRTADSVFKFKYAYWVFSAFLACSTCPTLPTYVYKIVEDVEAVAGMNLAKFVLDTLAGGVNRLNVLNQTGTRGCLFFLQIFFLERVVPNKKLKWNDGLRIGPLMAHWSQRDIITRIKAFGSSPFWIKKDPVHIVQEISVPKIVKGTHEMYGMRKPLRNKGAAFDHVSVYSSNDETCLTQFLLKVMEVFRDEFNKFKVDVVNGSIPVQVAGHIERPSSYNKGEVDVNSGSEINRTLSLSNFEHCQALVTYNHEAVCEKQIQDECGNKGVDVTNRIDDVLGNDSDDEVGSCSIAGKTSKRVGKRSRMEGCELNRLPKEKKLLRAGEDNNGIHLDNDNAADPMVVTTEMDEDMSGSASKMCAGLVGESGGDKDQQTREDNNGIHLDNDNAAEPMVVTTEKDEDMSGSASKMCAGLVGESGGDEDQQMDITAAIMSKGHLQQMFVSSRCKTVCGKALSLMLMGGCVSSEIIDCWAGLMTADEKKNENEKGIETWFFSSLFAKKILNGRRKQTISRLYTETIGPKFECTGPISNCKQIFVPVWKDGHWFGFVIDFVLDTVYIFDSMLGALNNQKRADAVKTLVEWMQLMVQHVASKVEENAAYVKDLRTFPVKRVQVPQQSNGSDSGIFLMRCMEHFRTVLEEKPFPPILDSKDGRKQIVNQMLFHSGNKIKEKLLQKYCGS